MTLLTLDQYGKAFRLVAPEGTYSYYHPEKLFTGFGWDAQTASLLFAKQPIESILILGLGGGTVARQCRALFSEAHITGVELNPQVLELARENFALGSLGIEAINSSGESFIKNTSAVFDAIIDDMWLPNATDVKPLFIEPDWPRLINARLKNHGLYAINLYSRGESRYEVRTATRRLAAEFEALREVQPPMGQTTVIVAGRELPSPRAARERLRSLPSQFADELRAVRFHSLSI